MTQKNNSTIYFPYGKIFCKLHIYNFLFRNYNMEDVNLKIDVYELNGAYITTKIYHLKDDESIILDSFKMNFKRDVILELSVNSDIDIKGIIRAFSDYYTLDGLITSVHEQGAFWSSSIDISAQGDIPILNKKDIDTYIFIQNTHFKQKPIYFNVAVYNDKGEKFVVKGQKLKYKEFVKFNISKKAKDFIKNSKNPHCAVEYSGYIGRVAYMHIGKKYDFISVSHGAYYAFDKRLHTPRDYYYSKNSHTIQSFVFLNKYNKLNSKVLIYNDYEEELLLDVLLYNKQGELLKKFKNILTIKHNQAKEITNDLLKIKDKFIGSIKIIAKFKNKRHPLHIKSNYILYNQNFMADSAISFVPYLNYLDEKFIEENNNRNGLRIATSFRSRQFGRGIINKTYKSYLIISFTSDENISTTTKVSFISKSGNISITKYITLHSNEPFFKDIENILTKKELDILGKQFSIYLRNKDNKVFSFVVLQNRKTKDIGMDHFVGA